MRKIIKIKTVDSLTGRAVNKYELQLERFNMRIFFMILFLLVYVRISCFAEEKIEPSIENDLIKLIKEERALTAEEKLAYTNYITSNQSVSFDLFLSEYSKFAHLLKEFEPKSDEYRSSLTKLYCLGFLFLKKVEFRYSKMTQYMDIFAFDFNAVIFGLSLVEKIKFVGTPDEEYLFYEKVMAKFLTSDYRFDGGQSLSLGMSISFDQCIKKLLILNPERFKSTSKKLFHNMINNNIVLNNIALSVYFGVHPDSKSDIEEFAKIPANYFFTLNTQIEQYSKMIDYHKFRLGNLEESLKVENKKK